MTLKQLLTDSKYRKMTVSELGREIDNELAFTDFQNLEGEDAFGKAETLIKGWNYNKLVKENQELREALTETLKEFKSLLDREYTESAIKQNSTVIKAEKALKK